jgi:PAS domain S-box-containing protein/putative nucleotidyltransferase with HDIG domain
MKRVILQSIFRIVLIYLLFGGLWIAVSDRILESLIADPHRLTLLQTYKGWFFVAASALLLYVVARREFRIREKAETALRESVEKYRVLMKHANDGIVIVDAGKGTILDANRKIEELTGLPMAQLLGRQLTELHPLRETARCQALFEELQNKGRAVEAHLCVLHTDGREIPVEVSANIVEIGGKRVIQGIFRDITLRKAAEEAMQKEKERAEQYLDIAGVMLVVIDREGTVTLINKKGSEMLGYSEEEIVGKKWYDHFVPDRIRSELKTIFSRLIAGELASAEYEYYESPIRTREGGERMVAWHTTFFKDDKGRILGGLRSGEDITERKKAEDQARYRLEHLSALHAIDLTISSSLDLRVTLREFVALVLSQLRVDAADVLLLDPHTKMLEYAAMLGFRNTRIRHSVLRLGEGVAGRAALEHRRISIPNLQDPQSGYVRSPLLEGEGFVAYHVVPLIAKGQIKGVLEVFHRAPVAPDDEWTDFLEALAAQAAIAIDNAALFDELQRSNTDLILAYDTTIEGWAKALELRDQETEGHTRRTAEITVRMARAMGMTEAELAHARRGALLHDIGKMSIPDSILLKDGPLTDEEWQIMRRHPVYAFELLSPIRYLRPALDIPYCHHERWDGSGYPRGLKGEKIPLAARIFALADIWDALMSERRYHAAWPEERVREHIRSLAGAQLDPKVVEVFLNMEWTQKEEIEAEPTVKAADKSG